jgi:hypothetical protein
MLLSGVTTVGDLTSKRQNSIVKLLDFNLGEESFVWLCNLVIFVYRQQLLLRNFQPTLHNKYAASL